MAILIDADVLYEFFVQHTGQIFGVKGDAER